MTELELATGVLAGAWKTANEAMRNATQAEAEVVRLTFLDYAARKPKVKGFSFESEYQYNDEGGYFVSTSVYPLVTCNNFDDDYELMDLLNGYSQGAIAMVCGEHSDQFSGECTVAQAKERRF